MPVAKINYALAASLAASGLTMAEIAPRVGAKNGNTLRVGLSKRGVTTTVVRQLPIYGSPRSTNAAANVASQVLQILSEKSRKRMAEAVSSGIELCASVPMVDIGTDSALKHAQTLKSLAETGKIAFADWNEQPNTSLVQVNILNQLNGETVKDDSVTIDVKSEPA